MVHKMMVKVFKQLIARFRGLGSTVVYADFRRLIICTHKFSAVQAFIYSTSVLNIIKSKPLFALLAITPDDVYNALLFMDHANWGALRTPATAPDQQQNQPPPEPELLSNW